MEKIYSSIGIRRQSFHDWLNGKKLKAEMLAQLLPIVRKIRKQHPGMSSRIMYELIKPDYIGRDKFIQWCNSAGFKLELKRNPSKTTNSYGVTKFANKLKGLKIEKANQVWVSDITYYQIKEKHYYITLIMDQYSKAIVGYHASVSLRTANTTIPALKMALSKTKNCKGLIIHSDGGGQYYCKEFLKLTGDAEMVNSMTEDIGENNHAERLNGTIKNQYLSYYMPTRFSALKTELQRAVKNYNQTRPHQSIRKQFPQQLHDLSTKKQLLTKEKRSKKEKSTMIMM